MNRLQQEKFRVQMATFINADGTSIEWRMLNHEMVNCAPTSFEASVLECSISDTVTQITRVRANGTRPFLFAVTS